MSILTDIKVLDLTDEKGQFGSKLLADMGAEVTLLIRPGESVPVNYANTGKRCISLNIQFARGRKLLRQLIKNIDLVVESFPPGYLSSIRLDYKRLSRINPGLIMISLTNFGQTGPHRNYKSSDLVASAAGGQAYVCGEADGPPLKPFGPQAYNTAGLFAANGALLALWQRHLTGRGQYLDISIHECVAATLDHVLVRRWYRGEIARRQGSLYWNEAFRIFPCRDGHIVLSLSHQWDTLVELLHSEGLAGDLTDKKWQNVNERRRNIDHIITILENWTRQHTVNELRQLGQLMHFPWANVAAIPELVKNPQLNARGFFQKVKDKGSGRAYQFPGAPVKMSGSPWQVNPHVPEAGEFNREIYQKRLGLSVAAMEQLAREGVI